MRILSYNVKNILANFEIITEYLIKIVTPGTTLLDTTASTALTTSYGIFQPNANVSLVEPPKLSDIVDREVFKIVYTDPLFEKRAIFETGLTGSKVTVLACFKNTTGATIGTILPNQFLTDTQDLVIVYEGVADSKGYVANPEEGTVLATFNCSSPMADLNLTRAFYTSKEEMQQINNLDTAFDQVSNGSSKVSYLWGKA